jgi:hypothetical protein
MDEIEIFSLWAEPHGHRVGEKNGEAMVVDQPLYGDRGSIVPRNDSLGGKLVWYLWWSRFFLHFDLFCWFLGFVGGFWLEESLS